MIDFSRNVDTDIAHQCEKTAVDNKCVKQTDERNVHVDYDFADRGVQLHGNDMIGAKVPETAKVDRPKADDSIRRKFDTKRLIGYSRNTDDCELTK